MKTLARWESRGGKHWAEFDSCEVHGTTVYGYHSNGASGSFGTLDYAAALAEMEGKVATGYFLPDNARTPMRKVK